MTIAYLHLLRLHPSTTTPSSFLAQIHTHAPYSSPPSIPLVTSLTHIYVARPQLTHTASLNRPWDVLVVLLPTTSSSPAPIPASLQKHIATSYSLKLAIPSRIIATYPSTNEALRAPLTRLGYLGTYNAARLKAIEEKEMGGGNVKESSQNLECSPELLAFARGMVAEAETSDASASASLNAGRARIGGGKGDGLGAGSVTMLNLLRFNEGEPGRESYKRYGQAFGGKEGEGDGVGSLRGGVAKIVGKVVGKVGVDGVEVEERVGEGEKWDEVAIVHYPK